MHPAYSVILFTTASGAGLGLLAWLALFATLGLVPAERWLGFTGFALAFALFTAGLLASTAHLGRPERAWRAFSQWRTSWLSREGVMAVATYVPAGLLGAGWVFLESTDGFFRVMAALTIGCAVLTLLTTGMIYASLRTIRQWHQPLTTPIYIALGLASGAVLINLLLALFGQARPWTAWLAVVGLAICAALKWAYWLRIDGEAREYTIEAATGLGALGKVRVLEPPHTRPNYIMREMGYRIARKHAQKLRQLVLIFAFGLPVILLLLSQARGMAVLGAFLATLSMALGLVVERWLFFAEAEHVSMLYYGAEAA
jgi:DMSO reductase anchor subunit